MATELHYRRDDTTPFVIQSEGKASSIICGQLGVMRLNSGILKDIPPDLPYVTLTIPSPLHIRSFLWVWYSLNGIENPEFPSTVREAIYIWRYLQLFGVDLESTITFQYIKRLNEMSFLDQSPNPELFSIMTDMFEKIHKKMIPPPAAGKETERSRSLDQYITEIELTRERQRDEDEDEDLPALVDPQKQEDILGRGVSIDDVHPLFESTIIDRLYLSLNPFPLSTLIPPSMRDILIKDSSQNDSLYIVLGLGTPNVKMWYGRREEIGGGRYGNGYIITLNNGELRINDRSFREGKRAWTMEIYTPSGLGVYMTTYNGRVSAYSRATDTDAALNREYYSRLDTKLSPWVVPVGKTTYYIGRGRMPVQGNIITMSSRSPVIHSYYGDRQESSPGSGLREILLEEDVIHVDAFLYVWAYLNGQDNIMIVHPESAVHVWYYIRYFGISKASRFVDLYFMQMLYLPLGGTIVSFLNEIPKSIRNAIPIFQGKPSFVDTTLGEWEGM